MAMVSVTFKMDATDYVRMTSVIAAMQAGLTADPRQVSSFVRKAVAVEVNRRIAEAQSKDSGCDLGKSVFHVEP